MDRMQTLERAASCVLHDRNDEYGPPEENFQTIADFWTVLLKKLLRPGARIEPHHVALAQDLLKTARLMNTPSHADSWVDKAGYSACGAEIATSKSPSPTPEPQGEEVGHGRG